MNDQFIKMDHQYKQQLSSKQGFTCPPRSRCHYGEEFPVKSRFPEGLIPAFATLVAVCAVVLIAMLAAPRAVEQLDQQSRTVVAQSTGAQK